MDPRLSTARDVTVDAAMARVRDAAAQLTLATARLDHRPMWREMLESAARDLDRALTAEREARGR